MALPYVVEGDDPKAVPPSPPLPPGGICQRNPSWLGVIGLVDVVAVEVAVENAHVDEAELLGVAMAATGAEFGDGTSGVPHLTYLRGVASGVMADSSQISILYCSTH
jgi:hypothetical protein